MKKRKVLLLAVAILVAISLIVSGCGENDTAPEDEITYPDGPVKLIVARGSGGSTDTIARTLQPYLQEHLGTPVVVENVTGAGGKIGNEQVYNSEPDGYTLLFAVTPTDVLKEVVEGAPYEMRNFEPVFNIAGGSSNVIVSGPEIEDLDQLIEKAKSEGITIGKVTGVSIPSIALGYLIEETEIDFEDVTIIPYTSSNEIVAAVMGGHVDIGIVLPPNVAQLKEEGKVNVLTIFTEDTYSQFPDVPAFEELYPGGNFYYATQSIFAPPGTPEEIISVLAGALEEATTDPDFVANSTGIFEPQPMNPQELEELVADLYDTAQVLKPLMEQFESENN